MGKRVSDQVRVRSPRLRVIPDQPGKGSFFPGEVARMLDIEEIDHQRLRRIWVLVREQRGTPVAKGTKDKKEWARFDYIDLACTIEIIRICVDRDRLSGSDFRVALTHLRRGCLRLRERGLENPLLQAHFDLSGRRVVATIDGATFDVDTGQQLIDAAIERSGAFLTRLRKKTTAELIQRIEAEKRAVSDHSSGEMMAKFDI